MLRYFCSIVLALFCGSKISGPLMGSLAKEKFCGNFANFFAFLCQEILRKFRTNLTEMIRAACLQNETAPKSFNFKTKNGPKNDPKLPRKSLSLVLLSRISHRHYSKIFHREFPRKIKYFFTTRICRHGHAKK